MTRILQGKRSGTLSNHDLSVKGVRKALDLVAPAAPATCYVVSEHMGPDRVLIIHKVGTYRFAALRKSNLGPTSLLSLIIYDEVMVCRAGTRRCQVV